MISCSLKRLCESFMRMTSRMRLRILSNRSYDPSVFLVSFYLFSDMFSRRRHENRNCATKAPVYVMISLSPCFLSLLGALRCSFCSGGFVLHFFCGSAPDVEIFLFWMSARGIKYVPLLVRLLFFLLLKVGPFPRAM